MRNIATTFSNLLSPFPAGPVALGEGNERGKNSWQITSGFVKKACILLAIIIVSCTISNLSAQTLGTYNFNTAVAGTCPNLFNNVAAQPANATFSSFTNTNATCVASTTAYVTRDWNRTTTIDLTEYNQFTITPAAGYLQTLTALSFTHSVSTAGVAPGTAWYLRSSLDGYASNISTGITTTTNTTTNVSLPASSFQNIGAVTFRFYITNIKGNNDTWSNDNLTVTGTVNSKPANPPNPTSNSPQCNPPGVTLTRTGTVPVGETWYWQTTALGTSTAASGTTYNAATTGTYYIRAQNNTTAAWSAASGSVSIVVNPNVATPVFSVGASSTRCQGAGTNTYTATAANSTNITYSLDGPSLLAGNTINAATGAVNYTAGWSGTTTITATATGSCGAPATATHTVTVTPTVGNPVFALGASSTICQGATTVTYTATATNNTGITYSLDLASRTAGNTIVAATGAVTYVAGWSGTSVITASATGCNGPAASNHTVTITPTVGVPVFTLGASSSRCQATGVVNYSASSTNSTGITYSLDAASLAAGNTIVAATGDVTFTASWTGTSTVTATATGCNGPRTSTHTIITSAPVTVPVFTAGGSSTQCQGAVSVTYTATASNTTGITYSLDAASVAAGNTIVSTTGKVTFSATCNGTTVITASAAGCYGPLVSTHVVTITPTVGTPVFTIGANSTRCQGVGTVNYSATSTNSTGITYSLDITSRNAGNTINTATGDVTYVAGWTGTSTITASATGCNGPKTANHTVTTTPTVGNPVFSLGATSTRCQRSGTLLYSATATNSTSLTYTLDGTSAAAGNSINPATGDVTWVDGWYGTSTITVTATGCNGPTSASHIVTTNQPVSTPVFTSGSTSVRCQGAGTITYTATAVNTMGITYSLDAASVAGGNVINANTGAVTYSPGWSGTTTVTVSALGCQGPETATHTVTVTPTVGSPVFSRGATSVRCNAAETINYGATATSTTGITYSLDAASIAGGNIIDASTGDVTYDPSWVGTTTITASASGCNGPRNSTHTVTINGPVTTPVFTLGSATTTCQSPGTIQYTATSNYAAGISYSLDAASVAGGNSINAGTGSVTYAPGWTGTSIITATATGCYGPQSEDHVVTITPSVQVPTFTVGATSSRCQSAEVVNYSATASNSTGITYSLDAGSVAGGNTINPTTGDVTYSSGWSGTTTITATATGCNGPKTATHSVTVNIAAGVPVFAAGASSSTCEGSTVTYTAASANAVSMAYSLDAASLAAGNTITQVGSNARVQFVPGWLNNSIITASGMGRCNSPVSSNHTVTIIESVTVPVFAVGATSVRCQGAGIESYVASANNTTGITYSLDAASLAAGNSINSSTGDVTYVAAWNGTSVISASAAGCNGPKVSTHTVTITPSVGIPVFAKGATSTRCQQGSPDLYIATSTDNTALSYTLDAGSLAAGNTIDAATGEVTFDASWIGNSIITATATGCNGPVSSTHTVTTIGPVTPPVFGLGASSTRCQGAGAVAYSASATDFTDLTYSLDAASLAAGNTIDYLTGVVTYVSTWSGTSIITATAEGCYGPQTEIHVATITPSVTVPVFAMGTTSVRCQGAGTVNYSAAADNATSLIYSLDAASIAGGNSIDSTTGDVTFVSGWNGTSTITATATGCNGPKSAVHTVTITPTVGTPVFVIGNSSIRCEGASTITYSANATNNTGITYELDAASIAAGNTINPSTGAVTYVSTWVNPSVITATATGCNGPSVSSHTVTVSITVGVPVFSAGSTSVRCQGPGMVAYDATASNTSGITYSLDASSMAGGNTINPTTGAVTYAAGWSGTTAITASAAGCNGPATAKHIVTITPSVTTPVFAAGASSIRCQAAQTTNYHASVSNTTGLTYSIDATSLAGGNTIDPSTGDVTFAAGWTGTTIITASAQGCNGPTTATHSVLTNSLVTTPVFASGASSSRCQAAGTVVYSASSNYTTGITYTLDAATLAAGNTINATTGAVTYTSTWTGTSTVTASATGCLGPQVSSHTITTIPSVTTPVFTAGASSSRCQGAASITYSATANNTTGITYSLNAASITGGNTIDATTGAVTFAAGYSGTTIITASAAGCNGPKTATHTVTVTASVGTPVFSMGAASTRCQGAGTVTYSATASTATTISYALDAASTSAGNTINTSTGAVTYTAGWSGTTTITVTATGCSGPTTASHTVTVTPTVGFPMFAPVVSTRCQGAGTVTYVANATSATSVTYSLDNASITGGNTINSATGAVIYSASWTGTSTITATAAGCSGPKTSSTTVTITPTVGTPVFSIGATSNRCQGAGTVTYSATATTTTGITYSLDAASEAAGNTIDPSTGAVTYTATWSGNVVITATAAGCNGPKSASHTATTNPPVTVPVFSGGSTSVRCQGAGTVTYGATASNTTGITYSLDAASRTGGNTIDATTGAVTYVAGWSGTSTVTASAAGCYGPQTANHTITITPTVGTPVFSLGASSSRCQAASTVNYTATATNTTGISFSLDAASISAGNSINAATGAVTYAAGWTGTTTITATAAGCNGPKTAIHTVTTNAPVTTPVFSIGATSTRCQAATTVNYNASASNATSLTFSLDAASIAAGNSINSANGRVTYVAGWSGTSVITASATGCFGPLTADHTVTTTPSVGVAVFSAGATSKRCQGAGTVSYAATATNTTGITYSLNSASVTAGNTINSATGVVTYVAGFTGTSTITATAAGCNGPTVSTHNATTYGPLGAPTFTAGATSTRCQGAATVTYTATATNGMSSVYDLDAASIAGGNTINQATGAVTFSATWTGTSVITVTVSGCPGSLTATHTVTTTPTVGVPFFTMGASSIRCNGAGSVTYTATASATTGITYSLDGTSIGAGNTINTTTGTVTYVSGWVGTSIITAKAAGCNGPSSATHTVTLTPSVGTPAFTSGAASSRCQGAGVVTYTASSTNSTGLTYSLDAASLGAGNTIDQSTGAVTYTANWAGTSVITATATGCNGPASGNHTVTTTPNGAITFAMGINSNRLQGAGTVVYTATANNAASVVYSLDAASIAAGNTINATTGAVTYTSTWNGTTVITATASGCNGTKTATHTVTVASTLVIKQLYLSDPAQSLDRIDPVATGDNTTASTTILTIPATGVVLDASTTTTATTGPITIAHTTGSGSNRLMLVGISDRNRLVSSVTYGGVPLTLVGENSLNGNARVALYMLLNPASGTANVVVNFNVVPDYGAVVNVATYSGVDQSSPLGTFASAQNFKNPPTVSVSAAVGDVVYDVVAARNSTLIAGTGQTQRWNINSGSEITGGGSTKPGAATTTTTWTVSGNVDWAIGAVAIKPASAVSSTSFTQSPALCSALNIKGNTTITVTAYANIVSGTMPSNPSITATLRYSSTNIIVLNSPTYNSTTGVLIWTGTLPADMLIPGGQAITLDLSVAQPGVSFSINFDSQNKPSKIDLPVTTYIDIVSFDVYNAPYPGGSIISSAVTGITTYPRANVTDPFGYNDITGMNMTVTPPGSNNVATPVAGAGCIRTYEYVMPGAAAAGNVNISGIAKEGYENAVTASKSISFSYCTFCPPVANNDSAKGPGGTPVIIDVLANDTDPNNNINPSSLTIVTQPANGSALISNGQIVYLPNGTYSGTDQFTYQICDLTSPTPLCATATVKVSIDATIVDACSEAAKKHTYYIPYPEQDARTALIKSTISTSLPIPSGNIRTIISLKIPYPGIVITWDHWEDGYESNIASPVQSTTQVWGDGNPYNGIAPGYPNDVIPAGGSIVFDNVVPANPRVAANIFYDGRDKLVSSGEITVTQVLGEPSIIGVQAMKTNVSAVSDFGQSFTIPVGENFNSQDFKYTSLFIRASQNNTALAIDKDNNGTFETIDTLDEGESLLVDGGVLSGATVTATAPVGVDLHFGGVDNYSSREVPIYPSTWYSSTYYTPVPTTHSPDTAVVMLYNSLSRPITINWTSGTPASGSIVLPAKTVKRFALGLSATDTYKFSNPTKEAFTAIEIVDSYTPGGGGNSGSTFDWAFNLISEDRLTPYATIAWAPGSTDGTRNDNPIWVTPAANTTIYVKYNGDVLNGGSISPCGLHYDVSYTLNALKYKKLFDTDNDQGGLAVYTCDGTKIAAVYGEDPSIANTANPSWDVGSTIKPFCATKIVFANDDYAYTLTDRPVTIQILNNDNGFNAIVNPASVTTAGYLQPKHGTVKVNSNGTLLYTPNSGYIGFDTLEYNVCSTPIPVVCDVAQVIIKINACPSPANKNFISGQVFFDKNKDGLSNDGSTGFPGIKMYLYADGNCNAIAEPNELKDSVVVDTSGSYQFVTYPERTLADNFDGPGGASSCGTGTDGTDPWLTNWADAGDPSVGFCVTPAQTYTNTNAEIILDGTTNNYALRLKKPSVSATRTLNLNGATAAFLSFSYRRATASLVAGEDVSVQVSSNGSTFNTVYTITGDGTKDAGYVSILNQDITAYASANTYVRFVTNANVDDNDTVYIDNIAITYLKYPYCYITKVAASSVPSDYYVTTADQNAMTAVNSGTCMFPFDFGIGKKTVIISGSFYNDVNGLTDSLVNGIKLGAPMGNTVFAYLVDSAGVIVKKSNVNSITGDYSLSADVNTKYVVCLSTIDSALYGKPPASAVMPTDWACVGDAFGTGNLAGSGIDRTASNCVVPVNTGLVNVTGVNFGIEKLPTPGSGANIFINPGGTVSISVPANTFMNQQTGSDLSPGIITGIRIAAFPANTVKMSINGISYTAATFPAAGVKILATTAGTPSQPITLDPVDGYTKVSIPFYAIDNADKESSSIGSALLKFLSDTDRDGVPDVNDIDDDNDGITDVIEVCGNGATGFNCVPSATDPAWDDDDDGIVNWKDGDYGPLNLNGCVASLDSDGDGVPDFLDLDSDNDGIPDLVEAYGVDANGDGVIDNFTDNDGDGLSQNVDANNTGAAGSGDGLGFIDFDKDGVPNSLDLDSDDDGIPDIREAGGTDANNDGMTDTAWDTDGDGLVDPYDGDADNNNVIENPNGPLIKTSTDVNGDGRADSYPNKNIDRMGYPNPYDLDADGDGIVDAEEAGFPAAISVINGMVAGAKANGWSNSVNTLVTLTLKNTDGRGNADYLDIDSDDDGISDNVEGQPTFSYVLPTDADADGDGLADVYDFSQNAYGGFGITPYDHDYDGIPDYMDSDTDNDGAPDINEASKVLNINQGNIITTDADGDGMLDQFDNLSLPTLVFGVLCKNVANSQMGAGGTWAGPTPSGSKVQLVRSAPSGDRDWRSVGILPLKLISFTGSINNRKVLLYWKAENEQDVEKYVIERSKDAVNFEQIGEESSNHSSSSNYNHEDDLTGYNIRTVYYRLVQVERNGKKEYSKLVQFKFDDEFTKLSLYPNPFVDQVSLKLFVDAEQTGVVSIYDAAGKQVKQQLVSLTKGTNTLKIENLGKLLSGIYTLKIRLASSLVTEIMLKE